MDGLEHVVEDMFNLHLMTDFGPLSAEQSIDKDIVMTTLYCPDSFFLSESQKIVPMDLDSDSASVVASTQRKTITYDFYVWLMGVFDVDDESL